jgi:predicted ATPase
VTAPVWLVTGGPGAGKTSVCAALAHRYDQSIHVKADEFGNWSDAGYASDAWAHDPAARRAARTSAAFVALQYSTAGYAAVVDDTIEDEREIEVYAALHPRKVFLLPSLEVALARNAARTNKPPGDAPHLAAIARRLYEPMRQAHTAARGWLVLDSSTLDVEATVDAILAHYPL